MAGALPVKDRVADLSPSLQRHLQILVKGAVIQVNEGNLAKEQLAKQTAEQQERDKRKLRQRKVTQSGGVIYVEEAREIAQDKLDKEKQLEDARQWARQKKEAAKRKGMGWGKIHAALRRAFKKRDKAIAASQELHQAEGEEDPQGSDEEIEAEEDLEWEDVFGPHE